MIDPINEFIDIINDNEIKSKVDEISDDCDQKDELLAEIEYTGEIPDSLIYHELNGFSGAREFEYFLEKRFKSLRIYLLANRTNISQKLYVEIREQILASNEALFQIKHSLRILNKLTLISVIDVKINYCNKALDFIYKNCNMIKAQKGNTVLPHESDDPVYYFRIKKGIKRSDYIIETLHKGLKSKGYIDCKLPQFRRLFSLSEIPNHSPEPVIWKGKIYYHFSYFIQCINRPFLAYRKDPSNSDIALKLFISPDGSPLTHNRARYDSNSTKTKEVRAIFDQMMKDCGLKMSTIEKKKPTF